MQVKKFYIRVLAILMAVTIAVTTPLSDFADIKGMKQTHAVAPTLITLGGLFGAIAGAYGLYVAVDKLGDYSENWFNWTADNATDARTDLQKIKDGVTGYVISKAVTNSVADFLATKVSDTNSEKIFGVGLKYNTLPDNIYTDSFLEFCESNFTDVGLIGHGDSRYYESGIYFALRPNTATTKYFDWNKYYSDERVANYIYYSYEKNGIVYPVFQAYDSEGLPLYSTESYPYNSPLILSAYGFYNGSWTKISDYSSYSEFEGISVASVLNGGHVYISQPFYRTTYDSFIAGRLFDDIKANSYTTKSITVDYKTHGNNALDNVDALTGAEVSEETLTHLYDVSSEAYQNYLKSQQDNNDDNNDINYAPLASAMTAAIIASLKDMGYIKNPTDEPSGENVKEQLGNIQISLDGLIDAISQINPAQGLANIAQGIAELPQKITNAVTSAFKNVMEDLFTPNTDAMEEILNDFSDRFPWTTVLFDYSRDLGRIFDDSEPPKIYIHFQDSEDDRFHKVGTQVIFDASWYEPYKPTGDAILSVFIYAFFLWKLFKRIPDILSGAGMTTEASIRFEDNMVKAGKG